MKAVVLSGGQGTRLRPLTYSVPKQLIPVGGRSVLHHVLIDIVGCGISEVAVVTSPESRDAVATLLAKVDLPISPTILIQDEPKGLAHAFAVSLPFVGDDSSLLYLGDCLLTGGIRHAIEEHERSGADATILVKEVDDPSRYGVVEVGPDGDITRLVEKPKEPVSDLAVVGVYVFAPGVERAVRAVEPSWRGEYEITDALQNIVLQGGRVRPSRLRGWWIDTGTIEDLLDANLQVLEGLKPSVRGLLEASDANGSVEVHDTAVVRASRLHGPLFIDAGATIDGSSVGPGTSIGSGVVLENASVIQSIIMDGARVVDSALERSVIGPKGVVAGLGSPENPGRVVIGAASSVESQDSNH